ncbi:hypothetical protein [Myxococcus llanfairpwllgwyngyllgogerychwyrndrobwllllantysiliogogogochensis]|uniref:hypothetical protein n=1 Tax=Myxococcus llanfairpwllgwyngyllgogerychwyrndrobwllllantysiliogogogochensis TaxID=2590453 RepID=UPI0015F018BA|nr:hypothetical protein [Myxococcus llanfairpwllgwyngyllgogerychwyrndrobwllllantysiliogogogochensis]
MAHRNLPRSRASGGFTLLVALGVVVVVTMAVMLSYRVVGREADTQADARRQKEAFFAAEAGLAEGREAMRLRLGTNETYSNVLAGLNGAIVADIGIAGATPAWRELLPGAGAGNWNYLSLTPATMPETEKASEGGDPYMDYPEQRNIRYRVFVRDDNDNGDETDDENGQVWIAAVGEVVSPQGRPTRSIVQALITNQNSPATNGPGCTSRGCGPDNTFNNTQDQSSPDTTVVRTIP